MIERIDIVCQFCLVVIVLFEVLWLLYVDSGLYLDCEFSMFVVNIYVVFVVCFMYY